MNQSLYCPGCNARFRLTHESSQCPRCGAAVDASHPIALDETQLLRGHPVERPADPSDTPVVANNVDFLVGGDLHVYTVQSLIGSGGMGRVYLARHRDLHRKCAVKVLSPRLAASDPDYVERFQNEGRAAAAICHPNIITTHAIGAAQGYYFLEMEFIAGQSLQQVLDAELTLPPTRATSLAARIADALSAAHREHILHRDLKPDNILLSHRGVPKIADFGLAKRVKGSDDTHGERLVGTPNFMAPELFLGALASPASDVYALGVCYYLMLTGQLPFVGRSLDELMTRVSRDSIPNVRKKNKHISLEMAECLNLMLAKAPENRPASGLEAMHLLEAVLGQVSDIDSLLGEAFRNVDTVKWTRVNERYRLQLCLGEGRSQTVYVEPSNHATAERLLLISSVCCPAIEHYYEQALRLNAEFLHGSLAVRDIDGVPTFVALDTYPRSTVTPEGIRRSVMEVARRADAVEQFLTGQDDN